MRPTAGEYTLLRVVPSAGLARVWTEAYGAQMMMRRKCAKGARCTGCLRELGRGELAYGILSGRKNRDDRLCKACVETADAIGPCASCEAEGWCECPGDELVVWPVECDSCDGEASREDGPECIRCDSTGELCGHCDEAVTACVCHEPGEGHDGRRRARGAGSTVGAVRKRAHRDVARRRSG